MPRKSRIDGPGTFHHIIGRGINRQEIFSDNSVLGDIVDYREKLWPYTIVNNVSSSMDEEISRTVESLVRLLGRRMTMSIAVET